MSELVNRREFFKTTALLGGAGLLGACRLWEGGEDLTPEQVYKLSKPENILYTSCLQCNTGCPIKVKLLDGVAVKIDGNPRTPWTMTPHLPYATTPAQTARIDGAICPKGQAGIQTVYDPYRIRKVFKRAGPRGENKWITIPFEQAVEEIVNGGKLFAHVPGEEDRVLEGLKDVWKLRDAKLAKEIADDAWKLQHGELTVAEFKKRHQAHLDLLLDPDHPDLGPKNNQLVFLWGRLKAGREQFIRRFVQDAFGSVNAHGHTTVCQGSLYFTGKAMSEQYEFDEKEGKTKWRGGAKFYWQADTGNAEFILFVGASPFEANYGPPGRSPKITNGLAEGSMRIAVVDPRLSKTAAKAWKWVPIKPGTEAALALGMIRWIVDNQRFNVRYLENANRAAAKADGEPNWSNAAWLVKIENGRPTTFLRASDLARPKERRSATDKEGKTIRYEFDPFVVLRGSKPVFFDPYHEGSAAEGDLEADTTLSKFRVKSAFQLLAEEARRHTIAEWAEICGIREQDIIELAREFTRHGRRAVADIHRGVSQHTNGFYNVLAWYSLNLLIGNFDYQGGLIKATVWDPTGSKEGQPYPLAKMHPGKTTPFGISLIRHDAKYEKSTLFSGYPAKRPWFPLASDVYQEVLPSAAEGYPYPIKILITYLAAPTYSLPGSQVQIDALTDPSKIPLIVSSDITVGETSMYADYIFPDLSYLERWEFQGSHPNIAHKVQPVRQPVVAPIPETVRVFGEQMPICLEALLLGLAEKLGLPGFGPEGLGPGLDFTRPEDLYLKMVANVAAEAPAVPDAEPDELSLFVQSRRHLPATVFDLRRWQHAVDAAWWKKVVYVLNRGGRFEDFEAAYVGEQVKHKYGKLINLYCEKTATTKDAMTGKPFPGMATFLPIQDSLGRPLTDAANGYEFNLITYREISQTKSRTIGNYWLLGILPENFLLMNRQDAQRLRLTDGQRVRLVSRTNPEGIWNFRNGLQRTVEGRLKITEGIRPGVIAFALGFGHWANGAGDFSVDGEKIAGEARRGQGIHGNVVMRLDEAVPTMCLLDPVGASVAFYDTLVKVLPAG